MKFIGIDLGWTSGFSGLCCLNWDHNQLTLLDLTRFQPIEKVLDWIDSWVSPTESALIAVDAPTLIPNATGARVPDRLTHKYFGRYHAGCYPANLDRPFASRTVGFGLSLEQRGFVHAPTIETQQSGRYQIEVYPHPAMVHLFRLNSILKYKKGRLAGRKAELIKLRHYILEILPQLTPRLTLSSSDRSRFALLPFPEKMTGDALKTVEDQLDSLVCAYIGAYWWHWGKERNWVLGDLSTGYLVIPAPARTSLASESLPN
jgi:predicted RNase H-like nuclease